MSLVRPSLLLGAALVSAAVLSALGCSSSTNPATSDYVVTCVSPSATVWAGDTAATTITAIVAREGSVVSGAPLTFTTDAGAITAQATTDVNGFADADYFPSFAPGPVAVTVELFDGSDLLGDATCNFTVSPSLALSATPVAGTPGTLQVDPDCDVPVLLDVDLTADVVGAAPGTVATGVRVTGYRASWRRPDGTGTPGVDVPRDVTGTLAEGPASAPTVFVLAGLELIDPADVPTLACDGEVTYHVTLSVDVEPVGGGDGLVTELTLPVTFRRNCDPCP